MKKTLTLTLLAVLLTACAAPTPSPTMTPFSTVLPSEVIATSIPNVALTATPTDAVSEATPSFDSTTMDKVELQVDGYIKDLNFKETSKIESYQYGKDGPILNVSVNVDQTAGLHGIHDVVMPPRIAADRGIDALKAMFAPDMDRGEFIKLLAAIQNGDPDVDNLSVTSDLFDANKHTSRPEEMTLTLGGGKADVAEGSIAINNVKFVYGEWYENPEQGVFEVSEKYPWFKLTSPAGSGSGVLIDSKNGTVYLFVGLPYLATERNRQPELGTYTEYSIDYLKYMLQGKKLFLNRLQAYENRGQKWVNNVTVK